jgi:hypothetical protein
LIGEKVADWRDSLNYDPVSPLIASKSEAISYFARRDLLDDDVKPIRTLWQLPTVEKLIKKQQEDGSWKYPGKARDSATNYDLFQTIKIMRKLVVLYELNEAHPAIKKATIYIFSFQAEDGDIRGIYGTQYSPNYSSIAIETIIEAGYQDDPRVEKFFQWLLSIRLEDGGWAIPIRHVKVKFEDAFTNPQPIQPIKSKPSSSWVTDLVLRALTAHSTYRKSKEANEAGKLLISRFFKPDKYPDRRAAEYWTKFTIPFWWGDLLSSLNSLSLIGFSRNEPQIKRGLGWFIERQKSNGLWHEKMLMFGNDPIAYSWLSLAICKVFKRFYSGL